ncbi:hypothetical protein NPIL_516661 [Nephila pilipes]|uniref:Uncharacterized protein n=1 Tax=Nephila pilipes TaxID=299642 RepID=A0A8X6PRC0_NEPPI|nr:hypothetical protein NPIL_516661 [Nephila pilipes]
MDTSLFKTLNFKQIYRNALKQSFIQCQISPPFVFFWRSGAQNPTSDFARSDELAPLSFPFRDHLHNHMHSHQEFTEKSETSSTPSPENGMFGEKEVCERLV